MREVTEHESPWPIFAKITVIAQLALSAFLVVAVLAVTHSSPVTSRDVKIQALQDRLREAEKQVSDLKQYQNAVEAYNLQREQWEHEKEAERRWRAATDAKLSQLLESYRERDHRSRHP